jgi:hypothetical protein
VPCRRVPSAQQQRGPCTMRLSSVRLSRRDRRSERRLEQDERSFPTSLQCATCLLRRLCGGVARESGGLSCLEDCCGRKADCNRVCPVRERTYYEALEEIGGFEFDGVIERTVRIPQLPRVAFLIKNGASRRAKLVAPAVAVRLFDVIDPAAGRLRYPDRTALADAMRIDETVPLVLSGVDEDQPLEDWWELEPQRQAQLLKELRLQIRPELVTTPNYSLFTTVPRFSDLHSIRRIELVWRDMARAELPTALHVNARTARDYERWTEFVLAQPGIEFIAVEWATIARSKRTPFHIEHLARLATTAQKSGRQLGLVSRGTSGMVPLTSHFSRYLVVDADPFMKAVKRQAIVGERECGRSKPVPRPTAPGSTIDELLAANVRIRYFELTERIEMARSAPTPVSL